MDWCYLIILPALQKILETACFRKQSISICSKGAAKESWKNLCSIYSSMPWIGNEILTSPNLCSPAKYQGSTRTASLPAVVGFSRQQVFHVCVLFCKTHPYHQVLQWCYMPGLPLSRADICVQGIPPLYSGRPSLVALKKKCSEHLREMRAGNKLIFISSKMIQMYTF